MPNLPTEVVPYLCVDGGAAALAFYREAFGAVEVARMADDNNAIMHSEFTIGGARFFLSDEFAALNVLSAPRLGGWAVSLSMEVDDVEVLVPRLVNHGAQVERDIADGPHEGYRHAWVVDPFGQRWHLHSKTDTD